MVIRAVICAGLLGLAACSSADSYTCASTSACVFEGATGVCERNGACSFPDPACGSGRRYGEFSVPELAGLCVGDEPIENDDDDDGVDDGVDNCLGLKNPTQHDEDDDMRGDACDPCPPFADGMTIADGDGDGVSDACDPEPSAGNRIIEFHGFDAGKPAAFTTQGTAMWMFANDEATVLAEEAELGMLLTPSPGSEATISTALTIQALDSLGTRVAGVVDLYDIGGSHGTSCVLIREPSGAQSLLLSDTQNSATYGTMPLAVINGTMATVTSRRAGPSITCSTETISVTGAPAFTPTAASLGLRARGATVRFAWVMLVAR